MSQPSLKRQELQTPSSMNALVAIDDFIEGHLRALGASQALIADIAISVSELVTNAVIHGNAQDPTRFVIASIGCQQGKIEISIADQGNGFHPEEIADPLAEENLLKSVGRGVFIVRALMDSVSIDPTPQGTTITITKQIA